MRPARGHDVGWRVSENTPPVPPRGPSSVVQLCTQTVKRHESGRVGEFFTASQPPNTFFTMAQRRRRRKSRGR